MAIAICSFVKESYVVALNFNVRFVVTVASPFINTIALCAVKGQTDKFKKIFAPSNLPTTFSSE